MIYDIITICMGQFESNYLNETSGTVFEIQDQTFSLDLCS